MKTLLIANILALVSAILMLLTGISKKKKQILIIQTIQMIFSIISNILLGGITGCIMNILGCIRNIICYYEKFGIKCKIFFIISALVFSIPFNNLGLIGLLPVIANIVFICSMNIKNISIFKFTLAFTTFLWCIYDFRIQSYIYSIFDLIAVISHIIVAIKIQKNMIK